MTPIFRFERRPGIGVFRICGWPIGWAGSREWGTWWLGLGSWRLMFKAPWNEPTFSEREGLKPTMRLPFGWRAQCFFVFEPR